MTRSISKNAQAALLLFEPKKLSNGKVLINKCWEPDEPIEVSYQKAMVMLVNFVVFRVIGKHIDKAHWTIKDRLQRDIIRFCKDRPQVDWLHHKTGLYLEVWYISREIVRFFIEAVRKK